MWKWYTAAYRPAEADDLLLVFKVFVPDEAQAETCARVMGVLTIGRIRALLEQRKTEEL